MSESQSVPVNSAREPRRHLVGVLLVLTFAAFIGGNPVRAKDDGRPSRPNVVLILTDDLGWQDVKCYDIDEPSPMETPHLDGLAGKGVMFWQGYAPAPTCAPTRCAIMSGVHPARAQKTHVVGGAPPTPHHKQGSRVMPPWYSGRMPADEITLPKALKKHGYVTGHSGKWHMAIDHHAYPQPEDQGFDFTRSNRGATIPARPDRVSGFDSPDSKAPHGLDDEGFPVDQTTEEALQFLRENHSKPFFLYYATWLVHTPIHTRSRALLEKYCRKLEVPFPTDPTKWELEGQRNPYYCAMVEQLDHYVGRVVRYLEDTDDPRWPGHKLIENTYIIFTSDNGGMERTPGEIITDNAPLDRGKISAREGGTRVPLMIVGPGIPQGVRTDVMANGLDFYPTIFSLAGLDLPDGKKFDGCDLKPLLTGDPRRADLVRHSDGSVRDTMVWHFPHSAAMESTIRVGDWKLIHKYDHLANRHLEKYQLFRLYRTVDGKSNREDIEEARDLAKKEPEKVAELAAELDHQLAGMKASYPYYNPHNRHALPHKEKVPVVDSHKQTGDKVVLRYREKGSKVVRADLIYTRNGGQRYEEWYRAPAVIGENLTVTAELPEGTTHYVVNLIDEHQFLRSYPELPDQGTMHRERLKYSDSALKNGSPSAGSKVSSP
ncbi:MAG: sulfatase [Haloferula sp.]